MCKETPTTDTPAGCLPFDLTKALAGAPLVFRDGTPVTKFQPRQSSGWSHPYEAFASAVGSPYWVDCDGRQVNGLTKRDVFLKAEKPVDAGQAQRADAWMAVANALTDHNPGVFYSAPSGKESALAEIRRLQALDKPKAEPKKPEPRPFDLEAAKRGEPLVTRDGEPVHYVAHVPEAALGEQLVIRTKGGGIRAAFTNGRRFTGLAPSGFDLFLAPKVLATRTERRYLLRRRDTGTIMISKKPYSNEGWEILGSKEITITEGDK